MTEKEKQELEARRKEAAIKNMYYTRYFSVRYATAFSSLLIFIGC